MPLSKVRTYLDHHQTKYVVISHSKAFTAQGIAAVSHISGKELAKTVIVKLDGALGMVVLPASFQVDLNALKKAVGVRKAEIASEHEFKQHFPDCETGAMPPFGNLYGIPVYVDGTYMDAPVLPSAPIDEVKKASLQSYIRPVDAARGCGP
jgi:Ala-tRNA(Pro) deacylase